MSGELIRLGEVQNLDREVKKCLVEAFKKTDEEFLQQATAAKPTWKVCTTHCLGKCYLQDFLEERKE